jgi:hypothetical protein
MPPAQRHGALEQVFADVFFVTGSMKMGPFRFSRNMVVLREGERLVVVNSMRLDEQGLEALDALGKVSDVIRLAGFHGSDDRFYQDRYGAKVWAVRGQTYFTGTDVNKGEVYFTPDGFLDVDGELPVAGASLYRFDGAPPEGILRIEAGGGTLITGDSLQNWAPNGYFSWLSKTMMGMMGFLKPYQLGPGWIKAAKPSREQVAGILELPFRNVLPSHGDPVLGDAPARYRPAVKAYTRA